MAGPFVLSSNNISTQASNTSPGAYILSRDGINVNYVGRSDNDLAGRLRSWVDQGYSHFWFEYASSSLQAFNLECNWYHTYRNLDNTVHPARPANTSWQCPRCNIFQSTL